MAEEEKVEGIVLRAFDYKDRQKIITLFTEEVGMISLIIKNISKKNYRLFSISTPFSEIEACYRIGSSELFQYIDGAIIDEHLELREQYGYLQTAGSLAQAILKSQLPGKPTPSLYLLFRSFLKQIPTFTHQSQLLSSFLLKLLRHEGLLALSSQCAYCSETPARFLLQGRSVCINHKNPLAICFNEEEWKTLTLLESSQHFSALRMLHLSPHLSNLITTYFYDQLCQY